MGGGTLDNTITFQENPLRVFDDPCGNFPLFTKESFNQWIIDTSNSVATGFTDASLNYLVSFDAPYTIIGSNVLENLSNIDICNIGGASLTDKFAYPEALTDICASAFRNMNLTGGLDFSGFSALKTIGPQAFSINSLNGPVIFGNTPSLEEIREAAFSNAGISGGGLDFSGLTALKTIDFNAFYDNSLNGLVIFGNNISLETIGNFAFQQAGISGGGLDFSGLTALKTIGQQAFAINNLNGPVIFGNTPSLEEIGEAAFYQVGISGGELDFSGLTALTTIGPGAFFNNNLNGPVIFGNTPSLETIGVGAFYQAGISGGGLDFSGLTALTTIGPGAFAFNSLNGPVIFGNTPSLEEIGEAAFYQAGISGELNFSGLTALTSIDISAFATNNLNDRVIFGNNTSLETIGSSAFENAGISGGGLDFSGLTALTTISNEAFAINNLNGPVIFGNTPSLETIGSSAFENAGISGSGLDFSGLTALTTIGPGAFAFNSLNGPVIFGNTPSLETIGVGAFYDAGISGGGLDFSGLTALTTIGSFAFYDNRLNDRVIFGNTPSLEEIGFAAFESAGISGGLDFSGLTALTTIGNQAFDSNTNITQFKFFDNSGCTLGSSVYPDLSGQFSTGATASIVWINTGFFIPTDGEYTWNVLP